MPLELSNFDRMIIHCDRVVRAVFNNPLPANRPNPAATLPEPQLSVADRRLSAALLRVNHAGEISAQALYQGQALTARDTKTRDLLRLSAAEENDHLSWCSERITELNGHISYLSPLWYCGSLLIGIAAGLAGDNINLGFLAETEYQVVRHLQQHLKRLPAHDEKSRVLLEQMRDDEAQHATTAMRAGAEELPNFIKKIMQLCSKVMTSTAYYI